MPPPRILRPATAMALALVLTSGLAACGDDRAVDETVAPVRMEDRGVVRGPEQGATPVEPPDPARAGNLRSETETSRPQEPAPTGQEPPPPPASPAPPPSPADDDGPDDSVDDGPNEADGAEDTGDSDASNDGDGDDSDDEDDGDD